MKIRLLYLTLLSWLSFTGVFAQSTIEITTSGGSFPTEKWVSITTDANGAGTQIWGQGDGTYGNGSGLLTNESISLAPGTYFVNCYDSWADGWDGTTIDVTAYGTTIGDNGGNTPNDGTDTDATGGVFDDQTAELEASFQIIVPNPPSCAPPTNLNVDAVSDTTADLSWIPDANATTWDVSVVGPNDTFDANNPTNPGVTNPVNITGLMPSTVYEFYVRSQCGANGTSTYAGPISFITSPSCNTTIFDTGGAAAGYSDDENYTITFSPSNTATERAQLEFVFVDLETCCDDIAIYDGLDTNAPLLNGDVPNLDVSAGDTALVFEASSASGALTLVFDSDGSVTREGFEVNFNCIARPACGQISDLQVATGSNLGEVDLSWTDGVPGGTSYEIEFVISGTPPTGTPNVTGVTSTSTTIPNLMQGETYDFYVRSNCGNGDLSDYRGPVSLRIASAGDDCAQPVQVPLSLDCDNSTPFSLNFANAIDIGSITGCDTAGINTGAWLEFTANDREGILIKSTETIEFALFDSCTGTPINCESTATTRSDIITGLTDGQTYLLAVWKDGTSSAVADICIEQAPTCFRPTDLDVANVTDTSAELSWTNGGAETMWDIEIVVSGTTPSGTPQFVGVTNPFVASPLTPGTLYDFYVRSNCGAGDTSDFSEPFTFRTTSDLDDCVTAATLNVEADCATATPYTFNLAGAVNLGTSFGSCDTSGTNSGGWFEFTTTSIINVTINSTEQVKIEIFDACAGNQVFCETDPSSQHIVTALSPNTNYKMALWVDGISSASTDICIQEGPTCLIPTDLAVSGITDTEATFAWMADGTNQIDYEIVIVAANDDPVTGAIVETASNVSSPYTATQLVEQTDYDFYVRANCGAGDLSEFAGPLAFTTECGPVATPYFEDFETFSFLGNNGTFDEENCWSGLSTGYRWSTEEDETLSSNTGPDLPFSGSRYFYVEASGGSSGDVAVLRSPAVDLSGLTNPAMSFYYHMFGSAITELDINISNDGGATFVDLFNIVGPQQTRTIDPWRESVVDLSAYAGETVILSFESTKGSVGSTFEGDVAIDDVSFEEAPACFTPTSFTVDNIAPNMTTGDVDVDFSWTGGAPSQNLFDIDIVPAGASRNGTPNNPGLTGTNTTISLSPGVRYDAYLRADCGATDGQSFFFGPVEFRTPGPGDDCDSAIPLTVQTTCDASTQTVLDFNNAIDLGDVASCSLNVQNLGAWYTFRPNRNTTAIFLNAADDVQFALFTTDAAGDCADVEVACGFLFGNQQTEVSSLDFTQTYKLVIWDDTDSLSNTSICVENGPTCPKPTDLTVIEADATTATFSWTPSLATQTSFDVAIYNNNDDPATATALETGTTTTNSFTFSNLTPGVTYDMYVTGDCDPANPGTDASSLTGPFIYTQVNPGESCAASVTLNVEPDCATATPLTVDFSTAVDLGTSVASCDTFGVNRGVWIDFVTPANGAVVVNMTGATMRYALFESCGGTEVLCAGSASNTTGIISALMPNTSYKMALWKDSATSGTSDICVTEAPSCLPVIDLTANNVTATSAEISWNLADSTQNLFEVEVVDAGQPQDGTNIVTGITSSPFTVGSLMSNSSYDIYVRVDCGNGDLSDWNGPLSITTACDVFTPSYFEDFSTVVPDCWFESSAGDITTGPDSSVTTSQWTADGFVNVGGSGAARFNIWQGNEDIGWLVSPIFDLSTGGYEVNFEVGLTPFSGTTDTTIGVDDTVQFLISESGGPWTELVLWDAGNSPSSAGDATNIPLASMDSNVRFAFLVTEGNQATGDINFYVDNFLVQIPPTCEAVDNLTVTGTTSTTADITFDSGNMTSSGNFEYVVVPTGDPAPTGAGIALTDASVTTGTYAFTIGDGTSTGPSLMPATTYDLYVKEICAVGDESTYNLAAVSFTTACATFTPDYFEDFSTYLPVCWSEAGDGDLANGPDPNTSTSNWVADGFANNGSSGSARIEIWLTNDVEWLITPEFDLSAGGYEVNFDVALTPWSGTGPDVIGSDDQVQFLISENGGPWTELVLWNENNVPSNTGDAINVPLTSTNSSVRFAFLATEGPTSGGDVNFYVDNFQVRTTPSCIEVSNLTVASTTTTTADITFDSGNMTSSGNFEYVVVPVGDPAPTGSGIAISDASVTNGSYSFTIGDGVTTGPALSSSTTYDLYVREICGAGDASAYNLSPVTFATACAVIPAPYFTDFENFIADTEFTDQNCWSQNLPNNFEWQIDALGGTVSGSTGPDAAFSGTTFMYSEASTPADDGDIAIVDSPSIDLSTISSPGLSFYYHMYGSSIVSLTVQLSTDGGSTFTEVDIIRGQQQADNSDPWLLREIDLTPFDGQTIIVRFLSEIEDDSAGFAFNGDVAIDDFRIDTTASNAGLDQVSQINLYPNPVSGDILNLDMGTNVSGDVNIMIHNALGQMVRRESMSSSSTIELDGMSTLSNGMYFITVDADGKQQTIKFLKE